MEKKFQDIDDELIDEFMKQMDSDIDRKKMLRSFAIYHRDFVTQTENGEWFIQNMMKLIRSAIFLAIIYTSFSIANWNQNIGEWKEMHREIASALGACGLLLIFTNRKKDDVE